MSDLIASTTPGKYVVQHKAIKVGEEATIRRWTGMVRYIFLADDGREIIVMKRRDGNGGDSLVLLNDPKLRK